MLTVQCRLHPQATAWQTLECGGLAISRTVLIQICSPLAGMTVRLQGLLDAIQQVLLIVAGPDPGGGPLAIRPAALLDPEQWHAQAGDGQQLVVVLGDGVAQDADQPTISIEPLVQWCLDHPERAWLLPVLPAGLKGAPDTLPASLKALNICFWAADLNEAEADEELALTVLARAGVTSLDRRVFISYRRQDTEAMALQLFQRLTQRNYSVFLDTVSIHPGVDFQQQLFEHLADKTMVVMLESSTFFASQWTQQELSYTLRNDLSLLVLRLPDVAAGSPLVQLRSGDAFSLDAAELQPSSESQGHSLSRAGLDRVMRLINCIHDQQMMARLAQVGGRIAAALKARGLDHDPSLGEGSLDLPDSPAGPIALVPAGRPPGLADLHDAATRRRRQAAKQVVIGRTAGIAADRQRQLDWAITGRSVQYCDVEMIDSLLDRIAEGRL
jgi:hypothetical protein